MLVLSPQNKMGASVSGTSPPSGFFVNPILRGSYPDPSICRVREDYYLVNSSFEYFPGLPIHHSKDLVNWTLVGYGLHREEQVNGAVNLVDVQSDGGIHAPSIRHKDGTYYIVTTNVYKPADGSREVDFVNFIITAIDPRGPWSMPHVIEGAPGIDPDIFFDDDGKVWFVGTHSPDKPNYPGEGEIWLQELDLKGWRLTGTRHYLWRGCGGVWAEGPHIYKRDGRYYLMIAEGGTSFNHAVTVAVSEAIQGPYIPNDRNPILTSRHLSYSHWVHSTGHADLIELPDGRWYMVALGVRGDENRGSNMGRETHLIPATWEREPFEWKTPRYLWPVIAPETGKVLRLTPVPFEGTSQQQAQSFRDDFETKELGLQWCFRRFPKLGTYSLSAREKFLRLYARPEVIRERGSCSLVGIRQWETDFQFKARAEFSPKEDGLEAGIVLIQKDDSYLKFTVVKNAESIVVQLVLEEPQKGARELQKTSLPGYDGSITFEAECKSSRYRFSYSLGGESSLLLGEAHADAIQSRGYTGAFLSLYCTSNGSSSAEYTDFEWVEHNAWQQPLS